MTWFGIPPEHSSSTGHYEFPRSSSFDLLDLFRTNLIPFLSNSWTLLSGLPSSLLSSFVLTRFFNPFSYDLLPDQSFCSSLKVSHFESISWKEIPSLEQNLPGKVWALQSIAAYNQGCHPVMQTVHYTMVPGKGGIRKLTSSLHSTHQATCPGSGFMEEGPPFSY